MEIFILSFVVFGSLFGISYFRMKQIFSNKLVTEQDRATTLSISESQLKQKNNSLIEELGQTKDEFETSQRTIDSLTKDLEMMNGDQKEIHAKIGALVSQLEQEQSLRAKTHDELTRLKNHAGSTTAELHATIEERTRELQHIQRLLHDESAAHKHLEEILSTKEQTYSHTIGELRATITSLEHDVALLADKAQTESSVRQTVERIKQNTESELRTTLALLESKLTSVNAELQQTFELYQNETNTRTATERALQESKEKLYAHVHELEQKVSEKDALLQEQRATISDYETRIYHLEQSLFNIINRAPLPIVVVNNHGLCEIFNDSMRSSIGFSPDDLAGKHFSKLFPEGDRGFYEEQWRTSANRDEDFHGDTTIITSTGDTVPVEINVVEIHTGTEPKFVCFIYDKTHENDAKRYGGEARKRAEELAQLKSRFISMVTNQLRAALVTVATNAELLERFVFKWNDEKRYAAFFRINESLKQMMELLRNVETTTSINTDVYKLIVSPINLEHLAQAVAKEALDDAGREHHFILSEQGDIAAVLIDERIVKTILYHLFSNAFKYSAQGSDVKVHIERTESRCSMTINDCGIGIPADEQKYLFTSFFRGSNAGNVHGTGLGLTIVHQYVQLAGGTITINSVVNKGTSVIVSLPIIDT